MESAATGRDAAPEWSSEIHITGDVALGQCRYYQAAGDLHWLRTCGYPVISSVADFGASRAKLDPRDNRYHILDVTGPNEAITHVDDDAYTNAIALRAAEVADKAARLLGVAAHAPWADLVNKMALPFDQARDVHLAHAGDTAGDYAHGLILLTYPLNLNFSNAVKRNDLAACLKTFGKPGYEVGMMGNLYSIVAAQLGDRELASNLFTSMIRSYAHPPYDAMTETPTDGRAVFLTAEGAFLLPALLPPAWRSLELHGIVSRGKCYEVRVWGDGKLTMSAIPQSK